MLCVSSGHAPQRSLPQQTLLDNSLCFLPPKASQEMRQQIARGCQCPQLLFPPSIAEPGEGAGTKLCLTLQTRTGFAQTSPPLLPNPPVRTGLFPVVVFSCLVFAPDGLLVLPPWFPGPDTCCKEPEIRVGELLLGRGGSWPAG